MNVFSSGRRVTPPTASAAPGATSTIAGHRLDRATLALLVTLGLGVFAGALDLGVLSPALPALARDFNTPARDVAWAFTLYLLTNVVSIGVTAKLADAYGRRPIYIACVSIFAAGSLLAILSPSFPVFLVARAVQAAGAGGIFPVATAAIADRVPQERRGAALGILGAVWGLAAIIGPNLGGMLTHFLSWQWVFIANIPLSILVILLAQKHVPARAPGQRGPLDVAGIVSLGLGLLFAMIGLTRLDAGTTIDGSSGGGGAPHGGPLVVGVALALATLCFAVLARVEARAAEPVISPALVRRRQIAVTYALEVLIGILEGALFFIPAALVAAEHLSYVAAGGLAAVGALMFVIVIPGAGRALDRVGSRSVLAVGALFTAAGLALFAVGLRSLPIALLGIVISGVGFGALLGAPTRYIVTNEAPPAMRASAVGLLSVFLIIGQILGGSLAGGLIGGAIENVHGYRIAYLAFAAIAVVTTFAALLALRSRADEQTAAQRTSAGRGTASAG